MKRIYVNEEYCIGCRLCEIHCLVQHSQSRKIIKAFKEETPRVMARLLVEEEGPLSFAMQCRHCEDAACVEACITGAMHRDEETGAVLCDQDRCVGCWTCIMVCPFGAIQRDTVGTKAASKCDLCYGEGTPACAANCPNEALVYEEECEFKERISIKEMFE
ncbi:MAG: 4Fe-4S dicluster domain-containing protein [Anaerolineae bacterium]|nr:4Fe-4S dicluster domain-containing protein [Anaerolineae bacterium]